MLRLVCDDYTSNEERWIDQLQSQFRKWCKTLLMMTDELIIAFNSWVGEWWWVHLHHIDCIVNLVYCWLYNVYCWLINDIQSIYNRLYIVDYIYCWLLQWWWWWCRHDICQQIYATAVFGPKNLRKKSINRDKIKSATKQRKCPKMAILRHLGVEMDN